MKAEIARVVLGLAEYYDKTLTEGQLEMYVEDLLELDPPALLVAAKKYRTDPSNKFFPLPGQLISMIKPHIDEKDISNDVANKIISAISGYGWTNPGGAEWHIGELGWEVVRRLGGWRHLCENVTSDNLGIWRAQIRDLVSATSKFAKRGELANKPALPQPYVAQQITDGVTTDDSNKSVPAIISSTAKKMGRL